MRTIYDPDLKAHLTLDEEQKVRDILHTAILLVGKEQCPPCNN